MRIRKTILTICMSLFLMLSGPAVLAETGTISLTPRGTQSGHPVVYDMSFTLYKVADIDDDQYTWTADFASCTDDPNDLSDVKTLAKTLETMTEAGTISGTFETSDENGTVYFPDLSDGLYLIVDDTAPAPYIKVDPFLVSMPLETTEGEYTYNVDASPKMEFVDPPASTTTTGDEPTDEPNDVTLVSGGSQVYTGVQEKVILLLILAGVLLYTGGVLIERTRNKHA